MIKEDEKSFVFKIQSDSLKNSIEKDSPDESRFIERLNQVEDTLLTSASKKTLTLINKYIELTEELYVMRVKNRFVLGLLTGMELKDEADEIIKRIKEKS